MLRRNVFSKPNKSEKRVLLAERIIPTGIMACYQLCSEGALKYWPHAALLPIDSFGVGYAQWLHDLCA